MEPQMKFFLTFTFLITGLIAVSGQGFCPSVQAIEENSINSKILCSIPNVQGLRTWKLGSSDQEFVDIDPDKFQVEPDGVIIKFAGSKDLILKIEIENPFTGTVIMSAVITVVIIVPAKIKDLQSINDLNDEYAHISCIASGKPIPQVSWTIESSNGASRDLFDFTQFLDQSTKDLWSTLRATESGTYGCHASNGYGTDINRVIVQLNVTPTSPETTVRGHITTETYTIPESASTTIDDRATTIDESVIAKPTIRAREILTNTSNEALGCVATGYPLPKIVWYYGNRRIPANRTYLVNERISSYVEQSTYGLGIYTCYATNPFGTRSDVIQVAPLTNVSHPVPVKVVAIKSFVLVPGSTEIQCLATGNPLPTINWVLGPDFIREKRDIKSANAVASYLNVNESSVGQYKCLASNSITLMIAHVNVMQSRNEYYPAIARLFNTTVYIEEEDTIGCIATGNPRPTIVWSKDNQELFSKEEFYDDDRQEVTSYLSITNGTGTYTCLVFNQLNSHRPRLDIKVRSKGEDSTNTTEISKPRVASISPFFIFKNINDTISCQARGNPLPEIIWYYGNSRIEKDLSYADSNTSVSSYVLITSYGTGVYTCYARNIHGVAADFVQVVTESNSPESITVVPLKAVVNALESDTIECLATGNPVPNIYWNLPFRRIQEEVTTRRLSANVVWSQLRISPNYTGQYMCLATHDNITGNAAHIPVVLGENVTYFPSIRAIKRKIDIFRDNTLSCIVTGNPRPTITWSKDNQELVAAEEYYDWVRQETTSYLTIENGPGYYTCKANNSHGSSIWQNAILDGSNLTDAQPPKIRPVRSVVDTEKSITTIASVVTGKPQPIIQWNRYNTPIQSVEHFNSETGETLSTVQIPENGFGTYECWATNWVGDHRAVLQVVKGPNYPYSPNTVPIKERVNLQEESRVGCVVTGNPKPNITWSFANDPQDERLSIIDGIDESFDNETMEYTSFLTITKGTGYYFCHAENPSGFNSVGILVISNGNEDVNVTTNITNITNWKVPSLSHFLINKDINDIIDNNTDIFKPTVSSLSPIFLFTNFNDAVSCEARGNPLPEIIWYYGNSRIEANLSYSDSNTSVTSYVNPSYYGTGLYTCYAKNIHGVAADFIQVVTKSNRTEPITLVPLETVVNALESDTLECLATGYPVPNIYWALQWQSLQEGVTTKRLSANVVWSQLRISPNFTGQYRCFATKDNITGIDAYIQVVLGETDTYYPSVRTLKQKIDILQDNRLSCIASGNPKATITWSKDNRELVAAEEYYDWVRQETTSYLGTEDGTGYYTCRANNSNGSGTIKMAILDGSNVTDAKPPTIRPVQSVVDIEKNITTMSAVVTGRPRPIIQWTRHNTPIPSVEHFNSETGETRSIAQIPKIGLGPLGSYECWATNWAGDHRVVVEVVAGPNYPFSPKAMPIKEEDNRVGCVVTGNPKPNITWSFAKDAQDERPLSISDGIDESFDNETMEYTSYLDITKGTGYYFCHAQNPSGSWSVAIFVKSNMTRSNALVENQRIQILGVNESTVTFKIRTKDGQSYKRDIYYLYTLSNYNENATNNSDTGYLTATYDQQIFTLRGLPKGSSIDLYFAEDNRTIQELNVESSPPTKSVLLLPPVPEISLKFATTEYVLLQWRLIPDSSQSAVDFYEVTYAKLDLKGENFLPPKYATETKIPVQIGSNYKLYRESTFNYHVIKVRAHNDAGYSGWSSLLLSPY